MSQSAPTRAGDENEAARQRAICLFLFFVMVFVWSWLFWIVAAALGVSVQTALGKALLLVGLLGPLLAGIGFAYLTLNAEERREYWSRLVDTRRIGFKWYLLIVIFVPALMAIAVVFDSLWGGSNALAIIKTKRDDIVDCCCGSHRDLRSQKSSSEGAGVVSNVLERSACALAVEPMMDQAAIQPIS